MNIKSMTLKNCGAEDEPIRVVSDNDKQYHIAGSEERLLITVEDEHCLEEPSSMDCEEAFDASFDFDVGCDFDCGGF